MKQYTGSHSHLRQPIMQQLCSNYNDSTLE